VYPFLNDRALEFCKYAEHLKKRPSSGDGCVDGLLFEIEVAPSGVEFTKKADAIAAFASLGGNADLTGSCRRAKI